MAKILLLAQGKHIERYANEVKMSLNNPDELEIVPAHMENALQVAKMHIGPETEVVMARATTADILRRAAIPVSVVKIPVSNEEIFHSMMKAHALSSPGAPIGFLGFGNITKYMESFLTLFAFHIKQYDIHDTESARVQIEQAKRDGVHVLIAGQHYIDLIASYGLHPVLMDSSVNSIATAYQQAREILGALALEKKKNQETQIVFNSVSDALVSLDADFHLTMINRNASILFERRSADLAGAGMEQIFSPDEQALIRQVMETGEENIGSILERHNRKHAMRIVPIVVEGRSVGAVVTLQEIHALQRMEATVRKGLYQKGNIAQYVFDDICGSSDAIRETVEKARTYSRLQSNVVIMGETGTGKELFAQSIHNASPRRDGPFVAVNCGAIPAHLIESELFGYEDGAFTGAKKGGKIGLFELAHSGTIFLDEISVMDQNGQVNLLRALQERQIRRVGGNNVVPVDVRVIAACNDDLFELVQKGTFRRDLFYRLSVLVLEIPPLRHRSGDVSLLAKHFVAGYGRQFGKNIAFSATALEVLESMEWDGNVRQLRNCCERIAAIAEGPAVGSAFVRRELASSWQERDRRSAASSRRFTFVHTPAPVTTARDFVVIRGELYTRDRIEEALEKHAGDRKATASALGISRTTFWKYCKKLGLS